MVDAQRDVIISLKLQSDPKNQTIAREIAGQAQFAVDAAQAVQKSAEKQFQLSEAGKSKILEDESEKRVDKTLKEIEKREKAQREFAKRYQDLENKRVEATQRANEAGVVAVQGLADMAEGAAKLGLVSEENFEKFAKNFVMIQEGIRVFKGLTDVIWKGREALVSLSAATNAQTAANNLLSASNLRVAGTQVVGGAVAGAAGGGKQGVGGAALGVAGDLAVGAAGAKMVSGVGGGGVLATAEAAGASAVHGAKVFGVLALELAGAAAAGLALFEGFQGLRQVLGDTGESAEFFHQAFLGWREEVGNLEKQEKELAKARREHQRDIEEMKRYETRESSRIDLQDQLRSAGNRIDSAVALAGGETSLQEAERKRLEAINAVRAAEKELAEDKERQADRVAAGHFHSEEMTLRLLKDREEAQSRLYDAESNRLAVIRSQNEALETQLKSEKERLATLREAKKSEEDRLHAKLGELNPALQSKVIEIAQAGKAGKALDRRDIEILKDAGVGQDKIAQYYAGQGKALKGSDDFIDFFGSQQTKTQLAEAGRNVNNLQGQLAAGEGKEALAGVSVVSTAELLKQTTEARIKQEAEMKKILEEQIKGLNNNAQQVQQVAADSSDAIQQQGMATVAAIKNLGETMLKALEESKKELEDIQLKKNGYQNP